MDFMDIDQVVEVPDTPDRLVAAQSSDGHRIGKGSDASKNYHVVNKDYINGRLRNEPREKGRSVTNNGTRRLFIRPDSRSNSPVSLLGNSCSSKNVSPAVDAKRHEKGKALSNPNVQRSTYQEGNSFVDLTEQNGHGHLFGKGTLTGAPDRSNKSCKLNNNLKVGVSTDRGKGIAVGAQHKVENNVAAFLRPSTSPRVTGQKRLVRNGCISPHNIAKSGHRAEKHGDRRVSNEVQLESGNLASDGPSSTVDIRDLIAEAKESRRYKGKGVSHHPSSEEPDASRHPPQRNSVIGKEATDGIQDFNVDVSRHFKESDGWRTTRDPTRKVDLPLVHEDTHISRGKGASSSTIDQQKTGMQRGHQNGSISSNLNTHFEDLEIASSHRVSGSPQGTSHRAHNLGHLKERAHLTKRQRQGASSSSNGGHSMSPFNDAEIAFARPSRQPASSLSTRDRNPLGVGTSGPVIALDELSPQVVNNGSDARQVSNEESTAMALQVEADEMLARELQEQLYNEELTPGFGTDEMDPYHAIAVALQQESSSHDIPARGRQANRPTSSGSSASNLFQHSRANHPRGASRAVHPPATISARNSFASRFRSHLRGRSRTSSSRTIPRNSIFPPHMDVDMRMHILEALESVGDLLEVGREFNENDYETLLALDDNNHQHGGATQTQINNLPQSTVQADNLQECAICLETPTIGETIRHLPCLHRFHKDCIDQWLRRKTSCPVCKSSIT